MPARHDQVGDPALAAGLLTARRGTAFFARKLAELSDDDVAQPSLLPDWTRAHVIAHVGYNARALTRLLEWARTGVETPMYASADHREREIRDGATLSPIALRHLVAHSTIHLDVEWRDLPAAAWSNIVRTAQGRTVPVSQIVWMRTREVWIHAVDLDNGAGFADLPAEVLDGLLTDITGSWRQRGQGLDLALRPTDRDTGHAVGDAATVEILGTAADLTRWATGRGARRLVCPTGAVPAAPRWL